MRRSTAAMIAILALGIPVGTSADGTGERPPPEDMVKIPTKEGGWKLSELVEMISAHLEETIVLDPIGSRIAGYKIEFVGDQSVPRDHLLAWLQSLLSFQRIVLVPVTGGRWMAVDLNASRVKNRPIFVPEADLEEWRDRDGVFLVSMVALSRAEDAERSMRVLAALVTPGDGRVNLVPGQPVLVLADFAPRVAAMVRAARAIEAASATNREEIRRLEKLLSTCATEAAARYFVGEIRRIR